MKYKEKSERQRQGFDKLNYSLELFKAQGIITKEVYEMITSTIKEIQNNQVNTHDCVMALLETFNKTSVQSRTSMEYEEVYMGNYLFGPTKLHFVVKDLSNK